MTRLTTVFGRSRSQNFFLTFSVLKASLLSRGHASVWIPNRGDMQSTADYPRRAPWSCNPLWCVISGERVVCEMDQQEVYRPTESPFLVMAPVAEGDGCSKDTDHPGSLPRSHFADRANVRKRRACAWSEDQFGRGQNTVLGWSDPTFRHDSVPKVMLGVAPALGEISHGVLPTAVSGFQARKVKKVKTTHFSFFFSYFFTLWREQFL